MTTNAGAPDMARESIGFGAASREDALRRMRSRRCSRRSATASMQSCRSAICLRRRRRVVDKFILARELQLADRNVHITLDDEARKWLTERGYDKLYGAR